MERRRVSAVLLLLSATFPSIPPIASAAATSEELNEEIVDIPVGIHGQTSISKRRWFG